MSKKYNKVKKSLRQLEYEAKKAEIKNTCKIALLKLDQEYTDLLQSTILDKSVPIDGTKTRLLISKIESSVDLSPNIHDSSELALIKADLTCTLDRAKINSTNENIYLNLLESYQKIIDYFGFDS